MKITTTGMLIEMDTISFKPGTFLNVHFELEDKTIVERVRSIKHYDKYVRQVRRKSETPGPPKKLCEVHFTKLLEPHRVAITKLLLTLQLEATRRG